MAANGYNLIATVEKRTVFIAHCYDIIPAAATLGQLARTRHDKHEHGHSTVRLSAAVQAINVYRCNVCDVDGWRNWRSLVKNKSR